MARQWKPETRPGYHLFSGEMTDVNMFDQMDKTVPVIGISGSFGSGKSTLISRLIRESAIFVQLVPYKTRPARADEKCGKCRFSQLSFRQLHNLMSMKIPAIMASNFGIAKHYDEFSYWSKKFSIQIPDTETIVYHMTEFLSFYPLARIRQKSLSASRKKKVILIETTPGHEKDWYPIFPQLVVVRLHAKPTIIVERLRKRSKESGIDPVITNWKILESLATPNIEYNQFPVIKLKNNYEADQKKAVELVTSLAEFLIETFTRSGG